MANCSVPPRLGCWASAVRGAAGECEGERAEETQDRCSHVVILHNGRAPRWPAPCSSASCSSCFMTGDDMSRPNLSRPGDLAPAFLAGDRAAGMEHAARRRGQGRGNLALERARRPRALDLRIGDRRGVEQAPWCRDGPDGRRARRGRRPRPAGRDTSPPRGREMWRTTARSWAMNRKLRLSRACRSSSRLMIWPWIETSSAETGSSHTMKVGSSASARAMPTRWRCPPDSSCG